MTSCVYCHKDKGRRECPALGGLISTACCGQHRGIRIDCPSHCKYFKAHEEYQRSRLGPEFHQAWMRATEPLYRERRPEPLDFIVFLEISVYQYFLQQTRGTDEELYEALEFLKRKLSPVEVIETPGSPLGKHLAEAARGYTDKKRGLDPERAQKAVDALVGSVQSLKDGAEPRKALHGLMGHVEIYIGVPAGMLAERPTAIETPRIVLPGQ